jgi:glycosyltransferase involved in cell wall biosynthesis
MEKNRVRFYKKVGRISVATRQFLPIGVVKKDQVSIVLRTKDRPLLLRRALVSLANQTFRDFEVILVNDGGVDISGLVQEFQIQFPIKYINNEKSKGRTEAINIGWQAGIGNWISYLDDDDILYPWHLEVLFQEAKNSSFKFIYSDYNRTLFLDENKITPEILKGAVPWEYSRSELLVQNNIPIHTWLYARECAEKIGLWDETLDRLEDYDYLLRLSAVYPFRHVKRVTCEYRYYVNSANSIYTDRHKTLAAYEGIYQKYPVDNYVSRVRRQEVLDMINSQIRKIHKIQENIGVSISREEAVRNIIGLVAGI